MTTFKPLADRVLVEPEPAQTQTQSGLYIPQTAQERPPRGTILAAGVGCKELRAGDRVIYNKGAGVELEYGLVMRESDVFGVAG